MIKLIGNLLVLAILYGTLASNEETAAAVSPRGLHFLGERIGLNGILALAAGLLIITGGIDLSMGSTVALCMVVFWRLASPDAAGLPPAAAIPLVILLGAGIGLIHGLLVTLTRLQPFVVTLCGLFIYRSLARLIAEDSARGFGSSYREERLFWGQGDLYGVPIHFVIFVALLVVFGIFLRFTAYGRYFYAIGSNEKAARYCGVPTTRYRILAYVFCSALTALYAVLNMYRLNQVMPSSTGNLAELQAIAAAVMGGCSLRGGEGNALGIFLGACVLWILPTFITVSGYRDALDGAIFGSVLLLAALFDELLRRYYGYRTT